MGEKLPTDKKLSWFDEVLSFLGLVTKDRFDNLNSFYKITKSEFSKALDKENYRYSELNRSLTLREKIYKIDINQKNDVIFKQDTELSHLNESMEDLLLAGRKYGLDLERIVAKMKRNTQGLPVVHPHLLEDSLSIQETIEEFKEKVNEINRSEQAKPSMEQNLVRYSSQQEEMIFCNNRSLRVLAGAGSGKSTSLILRMIFLHKYLSVPLENITVLTFTRESRWDFIDKFLERCSQFEITIDYAKAKSIIRTFHSIAYDINKNSDGKDLLSDCKIKDENGDDIDNVHTTVSNYNSPNEKLTSFKVKTFKYLYSQDKEFKDEVNLLYIASLIQNCSKYKDYNYGEYDILKLEEEVTEECLNLWLRKNKNISVLLRKYNNAGSIPIGNGRLNYHLSLDNLKCKVFLGAFAADFGDYRCLSDKKLFMKSAYGSRVKFIARKASANYLIVTNINELNELILLNEQTEVKYKNSSDEFPSFFYLCEGDIPLKQDDRNNFISQINGLIDFCYSIGTPLGHMSEDELTEIYPDRKRPNKNDKRFVWVAWRYHRELLKELMDQDFTTFDEIFYDLANENDLFSRGINSHSIHKLNHLLIDEFQDISPNIIKFIRNIKRQLTAECHYDNCGYPNSSITCVGDDYQSIYGWRGSSASFIIDFEKYFTIDNDLATVLLEDNYRSVDSILQSSQRVVDKIKIKTGKKYFAKASAPSGLKTGAKYYRPVKVSKYQYSIDYDRAYTLLISEIERFSGYC